MVNKYFVSPTQHHMQSFWASWDDGPKPSVFGQNLAFLSKVQVKMCKNRSIVASRVKTGTSFSCSRNLIVSMITVISDHFSYLLKKDFKKYRRSP